MGVTGGPAEKIPMPACNSASWPAVSYGAKVGAPKQNGVRVGKAALQAEWLVEDGASVT